IIIRTTPQARRGMLLRGQIVLRMTAARPNNSVPMPSSFAASASGCATFGTCTAAPKRAFITADLVSAVQAYPTGTATAAANAASIRTLYRFRIAVRGVQATCHGVSRLTAETSARREHFSMRSSASRHNLDDCFCASAERLFTSCGTGETTSSLQSTAACPRLVRNCRPGIVRGSRRATLGRMSSETPPRPLGDRSDTQLLSLAVHEFRTPASVVGGYLRMLQRDADPPLSERQRRMVDEAEKSCARIVAIVAELSDIGKLDSGLITLSRLPLDIFRLVGEVAELVHEASDREVHLELRGPSAGAPTAGDAPRLRAAFEANFRAILREKPGPATVVADRRLETRDGRTSAVVVVADGVSVQE